LSCRLRGSDRASHRHVSPQSWRRCSRAEARPQAWPRTTARGSRFRGRSATANGVSSRPFFPQFSGARGFEELGRKAESLSFFWPQTQGPKDFLGFGQRTKTAIIREFRGYPFHGRANSSRLGENGVLEEPSSGDVIRRFVGINGPELVDLS
jgi:hypothetical protein